MNCTKCGKVYEGYDALSGMRVDNQFYCRGCAPVKWVTENNHTFIDRSVIRDARNRASMWDGEPLYYTSMAELIKDCHSDTIKIVKENTKPDIFDLFVPVKLSGNIYGEHYSIYAYHNYTGDQAGWYFTGYVFTLREDMKGYPLEVKE